MNHNHALSKPWLMLVIRSPLFLMFQALIALVFVMADTPTAWNVSAAWWSDWHGRAWLYAGAEWATTRAIEF